MGERPLRITTRAAGPTSIPRMAAPESHDHPIPVTFPPGLSDGHGGTLDTGPLERLWGAKIAGCGRCYSTERREVLAGSPSLVVLAVFYAYQLMESWYRKTGEHPPLPEGVGPAFGKARVLIEQEPMDPLAAAASIVTENPRDQAMLLHDAIMVMMALGVPPQESEARAGE